MPKQFLDVTECRATAQQVCCKTMAKGMRRDAVGDAGLSSKRLKEKPEALPGEAVAASIQEQCRLVTPAAEPWARLINVGAQGADGLRIDRDNSLFVTLASASYITFVEIDVSNAQRDEF